MVDLVGKGIPFISVTDGVGIFRSTFAFLAENDEAGTRRAIAIAQARDGEGLEAK